MSQTKPIHEVKDQLSRIIAEVEATGAEVLITRHGKVVARLGPAPTSGVRLGLGAGTTSTTPDVEDLQWDESDLAEMFSGAASPT